MGAFFPDPDHLFLSSIDLPFLTLSFDPSYCDVLSRRVGLYLWRCGKCSPPLWYKFTKQTCLGVPIFNKGFEYNLSLLFLFLNSYCCPLFLGFNQTFKTLNREQVLLNLNPCLYFLSLGHDPLFLNQASWFLYLKIREQASWFSYLKANFFSIRFKYKYVLYNIWDIFAVKTKGRGGYLLFTWKSDSTGCPWNIWDIHCLSEIQI